MKRVTAGLIDKLVRFLALLFAIIIYDALTGKPKMVLGRFEPIEGGPRVERVTSPLP